MNGLEPLKKNQKPSAFLKGSRRRKLPSVFIQHISLFFSYFALLLHKLSHQTYFWSIYKFEAQDMTLQKMQLYKTGILELSKLH